MKWQKKLFEEIFLMQNNNRNKKNKHLVKIAEIDAFSEIFSDSTYSGYFSIRQCGELKIVWSQIVTDALAAHTMPWRVQGKTLIVACDHPIFAQQLLLASSQILKRITDLSGYRYRSLKTIHRKISFTRSINSKHNPSKESASDIISGSADDSAKYTKEELEILALLGEMGYKKISR